MIKAVFFDIDGTLVSFKTHKISAKVMEDLYRLKENGVKLFIASGRHHLVMDNLQDFPFDGYICMNGALVIMDGKLVYAHPMGRELASEVIERCESRSLPAVVFSIDSYGISKMTDQTGKAFKMINLKDVPVVPLSEADPSKICQFTIFEDEEHEAVLTAGLDGIATSRWFPDFFDVNPAGLSKAEGIEKILGMIGASREESIAFGDGGNDVEMLEYAGIGVAMGNAMDEVKSKADYVTLSVDEDGISHAFRHFGLLE